VSTRTATLERLSEELAQAAQMCRELAGGTQEPGR